MLGKNVRSLQKLANGSLFARQARFVSSEPRTVTLIPGDGIGPEIANSVQRFSKVLLIQ
jgi:hypothetical protein